jgi:RimJ/RimL family protein N-acetyltransferase
MGVPLERLILRDAQPGDRKSVLEFCRNTWPGYGDFIPRVWSEWIRAHRGRFIVAELAGTPVGIAKITDFGNGRFWLEGLRVDPRHRGEGIADAINREVVHTLGHFRPSKVRFCTGLTNRASRYIGQKYGFEIVTRFRYYWVKPRAGRVRGEPAGRRIASAIFDFISGSRFIKLSSGLISEGWVFKELDRVLLDGYLSRRQVSIIKRAGELRGVAIYPLEKNDGSITMGYVEGDDRSIKILARDCRYLGRSRGDEFCSVAVPTRRYAALVEQAGYARKDSIGQVVLEHDGKGLGIPRGGKTP